MVTSEQIINGIVAYADREVIPKLNTTGKWVVGTAIGMLGSKASDVMLNVQTSELGKIIGAVNEDGLYDIDLIADNLIRSAEKYGDICIELPMIGSMRFTSADVNNARRYIKGELR